MPSVVSSSSLHDGNIVTANAAMNMKDNVFSFFIIIDVFIG